MHEASFEKMRAFRSAYVNPKDYPIRVLDVGAGTGEEALSYRSLFEPPDFKYVGLDYAHDTNVDVVPADPFSWDELETEGFDLVLLGKTVEHTPFFWITAAEVARVLVPGGLVAIIAPSAGRVHRLPVDCWRFYPDSWPALCAYVGLDLAESFIDYPAKDRPIGGQAWNDAMMVGRKPDPGPGYYDRLAAIVATRPIDTILSEPAPGPAAEAYQAAHTLDYPALTRAQQFFVHHAPRRLRSLRARVQAHVRAESRARGEQALPWPKGLRTSAPFVHQRATARSEPT
jgi:SAM-dependent methyltransferase